MEPDVAGGGGGEPGGLEPSRRKRAGSGRPPRPPSRTTRRRHCPGPGDVQGAPGGTGGSFQETPGPCSVSVLLPRTDALGLFSSYFQGWCAPPGSSGFLCFLFHVWSSRTACGMQHPHCLNRALWGSFVTPGCSNRLGSVRACACERGSEVGGSDQTGTPPEWTDLGQPKSVYRCKNPTNRKQQNA